MKVQNVVSTVVFMTLSQAAYSSTIKAYGNCLIPMVKNLSQETIGFRLVLSDKEISALQCENLKTEPAKRIIENSNFIADFLFKKDSDLEYSIDNSKVKKTRLVGKQAQELADKLKIFHQMKEENYTKNFEIELDDKTNDLLKLDIDRSLTLEIPYQFQSSTEFSGKSISSEQVNKIKQKTLNFLSQKDLHFLRLSYLKTNIVKSMEDSLKLLSDATSGFLSQGELDTYTLLTHDNSGLVQRVIVQGDEEKIENIIFEIVKPLSENQYELLQSNLFSIQ